MTVPEVARAIRSQSPVVTILKSAVLVAAIVLWLALGARLAPLVLMPPALPFLIPGLLLGYAGADFLSGTVHWFCDTFFSESTPLIGQRVIRPFRDHHQFPAAITEYRLLEQDSTNYFILIAPLWAVWRLDGSEPAGAWGILGLAALWGFALGSLGTNLFHKWAHAERVPGPIRWLQRHRLILSPTAHQVHHRSYTGGYCVTSGWMNGLLDRIGFFPGAERLVRLMQRRPQAGRPA